MNVIHTQQTGAATLTGGSDAVLSTPMSLKSAVRLLPVLAAAALSACSSTPGPGFTKVKIYRLDPDKEINAVEPSVRFEQRHYLYGAVTREQIEARRGNYYKFFWSVEDPARPVRIRFEYRQSTTGFTTHTKVVDIPKVEKTNITEIGVVGEEFRSRGKVLAWRAVLLQDGKQVAETKSFLWE